MAKKEFLIIRHQPGKTQDQLSQLLGTSKKAIQSFEQGGRAVRLIKNISQRNYKVLL